jgi:hypothetical protein
MTAVLLTTETASGKNPRDQVLRFVLDEQGV